MTKDEYAAKLREFEARRADRVADRVAEAGEEITCAHRIAITACAWEQYEREVDFLQAAIVEGAYGELEDAVKSIIDWARDTEVRSSIVITADQANKLLWLLEGVANAKDVIE